MSLLQQFFFKFAQNSLQVVPNLRVAESDDFVTESGQDGISHLICFRLHQVVTSVELHDQTRRMAVEVHDKTRKNMLPAKMFAQELVGSEMKPESLLLWGRLPAQLLRQQALLPVSSAIDESHAAR